MALMATLAIDKGERKLIHVRKYLASQEGCYFAWHVINDLIKRFEAGRKVYTADDRRDFATQWS